MKQISIRFHFVFSSILVLTLLLTACNPAKKLTKTGDKLYLSGYYDEATGYYYNALLRKPGYPAAKEGLKLSAQHVLDNKFGVFRKNVLENQLEQAVKQYQYAQQFNANAGSVGVMLQWPEEYDEIYKDVLRDYSGTLFDEAIDLINRKKFDIAEKKLQQLGVIDSAYRHVSVLRMNTILEPMYNQAMVHYEQGRYNEAYRLFSKIFNIDSDFQDTRRLKQASFDKATRQYGIWIGPTDKRIKAEDVSDQLLSRLRSSATGFVSFTGFTNLKKTLESRGWNAVRSDSDAVQAGKSAGMHYLILIRILPMIDSVGPRVSEKQIAYESFTENIPNPYTDTYSYITRFKKIEYDDVYESRYMRIEAQCIVVSCLYGTVLMNEMISVEKDIAHHQFDYKGNINNLYEELPSGNYIPPPNPEWRELFRNQKNGVKQANPEPVLYEEWLEKINTRLIRVINKTN
ncbi:MAG: hypothetical protein WC760_00955 [Bacteroidia bacterium]|jgi:tetratricopeptide (TPR) repeat protein